mmetsp:Transcript_93369/g.243170  ORF Transcript_93369/g.243170 Transcript_93369/m.243170 type:complete len:254 (+) Transcript_93369:371-1132(+)
MPFSGRSKFSDEGNDRSSSACSFSKSENRFLIEEYSPRLCTFTVNTAYVPPPPVRLPAAEKSMSRPCPSTPSLALVAPTMSKRSIWHEYAARAVGRDRSSSAIVCMAGLAAGGLPLAGVPMNVGSKMSASPPTGSSPARRGSRPPSTGRKMPPRPMRKKASEAGCCAALGEAHRAFTYTFSSWTRSRRACSLKFRTSPLSGRSKLRLFGKLFCNSACSAENSENRFFIVPVLPSKNTRMVYRACWPWPTMLPA